MLMPTPSETLLQPGPPLVFAAPGTQVVPNPASGGVSQIPLGSGDIVLHTCTTIALDVNVTALTGGNVRVIVDRKGADGQYYTVFATGGAGSPADISATGTNGYSIGLSLAGANSVYLGQWIRIRIQALAGVSAATVAVSVQGA